MQEVATYSMADRSKQPVIQVVRDYGKRLYRFIRSRVKTNEDAEDILQDVWVQLSNIMDMDSIGHISGWLFQVARNKITDQYRKKKPESLESLLSSNFGDDAGLQELLIPDYTTPETESLKEMFWEELLEALEALPENQRQVFIWNELEGMTLQEIADKTGVNLKTIISRKGYAVKQLRKRLEDLYNDIINYE